MKDGQLITPPEFGRREEGPDLRGAREAAAHAGPLRYGKKKGIQLEKP